MYTDHNFAHRCYLRSRCLHHKSSFEVCTGDVLQDRTLPDQLHRTLYRHIFRYFWCHLAFVIPKYVAFCYSFSCACCQLSLTPCVVSVFWKCNAIPLPLLSNQTCCVLPLRFLTWNWNTKRLSETIYVQSV